MPAINAENYMENLGLIREIKPGYFVFRGTVLVKSLQEELMWMQEQER